MFTSSLVPTYFKEIFNHLPHALLDLISWKEIFNEVTQLSNRLINEEGAIEKRHEISALLPNDIKINESIGSSQLSQEAGEKILKLYFFQIMKSDFLFLDFRKKHFALKKSDNQITLDWNPGALWANFDPHFLDGLRQIYTGYYNNDNGQFRLGLEKCGLIKPEWSEARKSEVENVFLQHFSNGRNDEISFDLNVLKKSFTEIFKTLVKNKIILDKNFLYLGIMLITLYMTMNEIGGKHSASKLFSEI